MASTEKKNTQPGDEAPSSTKKQTLTVTPPNLKWATFKICGDPGVPLVVHRFSAKVKQEMKLKMEIGKAASSRKNREPKSTDLLFEEARYRSPEGWDGFHAAAIRNSMIEACRLTGFKMVLAKLSIFTEADGRDAMEPQIPLVRIYGKPVKQEDIARVETGQPYVTVRPAYFDWHAYVRIRYDADQFTLSDVSNLLLRVGQQCGIMEGRPNSKNSSGMGWGTFHIEAEKAKAAA